MSDLIKNKYKQTAVGIIPIEWDVLKLENVVTLINGKAYTQEELLDKGKYRVLRVGNLYSNNNWYYSDLELDDDKYVVQGDLMYSWSASFGPQFWREEKTIYHYHIWKVLISNKTTKDFIYQLLEFDKELILRKTQGGTMVHITKGDMENRKLPFPPLPEQQKIATILSTWDVAIDNCKAIIDKLKGRNKGLAQQLLTGKIRVKGFAKTEWEYVALNKIAKEISLKNPSDKELIVMSCTKYDGLVPSLEYFGRKIYSNDLTTYKIVKKGQFAYATNHIEEGSIGYQTRFDEVLISPMYTVFQTDNTINDNLLFKILKSHEYIHQYQKRMEGSIDRRGGLRWDEFSKIKVPVIEMEEQNAINNILDTGTAELNQYQQQLRALQLQKKGLMQQLLTGKVRVKINNN